jgi:hypothetical protein
LPFVRDATQVAWGYCPNWYTPADNCAFAGNVWTVL